ncbi:MAG: hypothetical protein ACO1SV_06330 [Fimbriimonas sp.]
MALCDSCGQENANPTKFCGNCGNRFVERPAEVSAGEDGAVFCQRHRKEVTRVHCGRCDRPICHRCTVMSAAGVRCRDCARYRAPVRMRGLAHDAASRVGRLDFRKMWYLYLFAFVILSMIARFFSGGGN